jgi:hypothetical protein
MFPVAPANGAALQQVLPMVHPRVQKVLAGIAAGALGGLALLGFLALGSVARQDPWWRFSNLAGTVFFGANALRSGLGLATLSGAAFEILICGAAGAAFGAVMPGSLRGFRRILLGMIAGLLWMQLLNLVYGRFHPLIPLYSDTWPSTAAHLLFGACLAAFSAVFLPARVPALLPEPVLPVEAEQVPEHAAEPGSSRVSDLYTEGRYEK